MLRALGEAARKKGTRYIEFGVRSLAVATGLDHGTVATHLRQLRGHPAPLIQLVQDHQGLHADLYELVIPDTEATRTARHRWRGGLTHALRPAFRELGHIAALVYEQIEHSPTPTTTDDLVHTLLISRAAAYDATETLAAHGLINRRDRRGWVLDPAGNLRHLAEQLGCLDDVDAQMQRYQLERLLWTAFVTARMPLGSAGPAHHVATVALPHVWIPPPEQPPDDEWTLFDLLATAAH